MCRASECACAHVYMCMRARSQGMCGCVCAIRCIHVRVGVHARVYTCACAIESLGLCGCVCAIRSPHNPPAPAKARPTHREMPRLLQPKNASDARGPRRSSPAAPASFSLGGLVSDPRVKWVFVFSSTNPRSLTEVTAMENVIGGALKLKKPIGGISTCVSVSVRKRKLPRPLQARRLSRPVCRVLEQRAGGRGGGLGARRSAVGPGQSFAAA